MKKLPSQGDRNCNLFYCLLPVSNMNHFSLLSGLSRFPSVSLTHKNYTKLTKIWTQNTQLSILGLFILINNFS